GGVVDVAHDGLAAGLLDEADAGLAARRARDDVAGCGESPHDAVPDEAGAAGDEDAQRLPGPVGGVLVRGHGTTVGASPQARVCGARPSTNAPRSPAGAAQRPGSVSPETAAAVAPQRRRSDSRVATRPR